MATPTSAHGAVAWPEGFRIFESQTWEVWETRVLTPSPGSLPPGAEKTSSPRTTPHHACGTEGAQGWGCCAGAGALAVGLPRSSHSSQVPVETSLHLPSWDAGRPAHVCVPLRGPEPSLVLAAEGGCSEPAPENPSTVLSLTQGVEAEVEVLLSRMHCPKSTNSPLQAHLWV